MNIVPIRDSTEYEYVVLNEEITSRDKRSASRVGSCGKQGEKRSHKWEQSNMKLVQQTKTMNMRHCTVDLHCS